MFHSVFLLYYSSLGVFSFMFFYSGASLMHIFFVLLGSIFVEFKVLGYAFLAGTKGP